MMPQRTYLLTTLAILLICQVFLLPGFAGAEVPPVSEEIKVYPLGKDAILACFQRHVGQNHGEGWFVLRNVTDQKKVFFGDENIFKSFFSTVSLQQALGIKADGRLTPQLYVKLYAYLLEKKSLILGDRTVIISILDLANAGNVLDTKTHVAPSLSYATRKAGKYWFSDGVPADNDLEAIDRQIKAMLPKQGFTQSDDLIIVLREKATVA